MNKNYNNTRAKLHLPEYGRHIQEMVESLKHIEDRAERNKQAHAVIAVMGNLNPLLRDTADFTHKLWDHMFIMSGFELDVDSPYPQPTREELEKRPNQLSYNKRHIGFKHYGRHVGDMIRQIAKQEDKQLADKAINNIARFMRSKSFEYNQEHPNNELIIKDIRRMADGDIAIDEAAINNIQSDYRNNQPQHSNKNQKGQKNQKNQKNAKNTKGQQGGQGQQGYSNNKGHNNHNNQRNNHQHNNNNNKG